MVEKKLFVFTTGQSLILASGSPRRQRFLTGLGLEFDTMPVDIDETPLPGEAPEDFALRMAREKAGACAGQHQDAWVIGADTVVTLDSHILGKPRDESHALAMLRQLRGRKHLVITGYALINRDRGVESARAVTTEVSFQSFPDSVLQAYVDTGEPMDKAGAYGIQGQGAFLARTISGSCTNVIGLPVSALVADLLAHGIVNVRRRL